MSEDAVTYKVASGPIRNDMIYLPWQVLKALRMVAMARGMQGDAHTLASDVLREWLAVHHPDVVAHIESQQQAGDEFQKQLVEKLRAGN